MESVLGWVAGLSGAIATICMLIVVVRMFGNRRQLLGIGTLVSSIPLVGYLIALIAGWRHRDSWRLRSVMPLFTIAVISFVGGSIGWAAIRISKDPDPTVTNTEFDVDLGVPEISPGEN
jgi:hypothetical protein